ncbi:MAG TPA: S28 family serine protease [Nannocystis sp.]
MVLARLALLVLALLPLACGVDEGSGDVASGTSTTDAPSSTGSSGSEPSTTATTGANSTTADATTGSADDILDCLTSLPGLTVQEEASKIDDYRFFRLAFQQPIDHDHPGGPTFAQRATLLHRDPGAPLVISTEGYFLYSTQWLSEPANLLWANQLTVEHRMFAGSGYDDPDWSTLTIRQAAADHHRIVHAFKTCYSGPRIATGASKGGMTASYFRRFYPDDVDVTIPYVAPLSYDVADPRYIEFVDTVGDDPACRAALRDAQRELLLRRSDMLKRMQDQAQQDGDSYDLLGDDFVLEIMALEMPFAFWQYFDASLCSSIPAPTATDAELWGFFNLVQPARSFSDQRLLLFEPYFWQAAIQLGAPAIDESYVADLLIYPGRDVPASFVFTPDADPVYDPTAMPDIAAWVATEGRRMLFVYGENDPWTAGAYEGNEAAEVYVLFAPAGNHGSKIKDLAPADREFALAKLEEWTGIKPAMRDLPSEPPLRARLGIDP